MVSCSSSGLVKSFVFVVGFGLFHPRLVLATKLPDFLTQKEKLECYNANLKMFGLLSELGYQTGYGSRVNLTRWAFERVLAAYDTDDAMKHVLVEDTSVNGVRLRIYKPKPATTEKPLPAMIFIHGGAWVLFHIEQYDSVCAYIAKQSNIIVISIEYRLAPEHPFPAGFDDCVTVTLDVLRNGGKYGVDSTKVAIAGDSAGGNMAAAIAIKFRDDMVKPPLKAMIPIYAALQFCSFSLPIWRVRLQYDPQAKQQMIWMIDLWLNLTSSQETLMASGKFNTPELQKKCNRLVDYKLLPRNLTQEGYLPDDHTATVVNKDVESLSKILSDPHVSPLLVEDLKGLPAAMVVSMHWDFVRDENIILAKRLEMAGNEVHLLYIADSFHGVINLYSDFNAGKRLVDEIVRYVQTTL